MITQVVTSLHHAGCIAEVTISSIYPSICHTPACLYLTLSPKGAARMSASLAVWPKLQREINVTSRPGRFLLWQQPLLLHSDHKNVSRECLAELGMLFLAGCIVHGHCTCSPVLGFGFNLLNLHKSQWSF